MIINIGPWWLYDVMAISIIIACTIFGMFRGFFVMFYTVIVQVIVVVILMFLPAIITNSLNPTLMRFWVKAGLLDFFSGFSEEIVNFLNTVLKGEKLDIDGSGASYELLKMVSALVVYLVVSLLIFLLINLIAFIVYRGIRKKIQNFKITKSVDTLLGTFNGLALGMILSMGVSFIASFPIFATDHQKIGLSNTSGWSDQQYLDYIEGGSSFKRFSISNKITSPLPSVPIFSFTYSNACASKYIVDPISIMGTELISGGKLSKLANFFAIYEDLLVEGYSTDNPFKTPVAVCVELMPEDSRSTFRMISELMLMGTKAFRDGYDGELTKIHSVDLINALDSYFIATKGSLKGIHEGWLTQEELVNFYNWSENNQNLENPFLELAKNIEANWATTEKIKERYIVKVLRDPKLTYRFLKNLSYVNSITRNNLDTLPYISSVYSSNYLFKKMELSPSGELKLGQFAKNSINEPGIESIKNNLDGFWDKYNQRGFFWIRYYFDFAYKGVWNE